MFVMILRCLINLTRVFCFCDILHFWCRCRHVKSACHRNWIEEMWHYCTYIAFEWNNTNNVKIILMFISFNTIFFIVSEFVQHSVWWSKLETSHVLTQTAGKLQSYWDTHMCSSPTKHNSKLYIETLSGHDDFLHST